MYRIFIIFFFLIWANVCFGQIDWSKTKIEILKDSICQFGEKYDYPKRLDIDFLAVEVDDDFKIGKLHCAVPYPENSDDEDMAKCDFFFGGLIDYDPIQDGLTPNDDDFQYGYTAKDIYFFDINGDGELDFIHYPKYYNILTFGQDLYYIFIRTLDGYKQLYFVGFIVDINFNENGILNEIKTFQPECCASGFAMFIYYTFDAKKNELLLTKEEKVWTCQFKQK